MADPPLLADMIRMAMDSETPVLRIGSSQGHKLVHISKTVAEPNKNNTVFGTCFQRHFATIFISGIKNADGSIILFCCVFLHPVIFDMDTQPLRILEHLPDRLSLDNPTASHVQRPQIRPVD